MSERPTIYLSLILFHVASKALWIWKLKELGRTKIFCSFIFREYFFYCILHFDTHTFCIYHELLSTSKASTTHKYTQVPLVSISPTKKTPPFWCKLARYSSRFQGAYTITALTAPNLFRPLNPSSHLTLFTSFSYSCLHKSLFNRRCEAFEFQFRIAVQISWLRTNNKNKTGIEKYRDVRFAYKHDRIRF